MRSEPLICVGASVRALMGSARLAGFAPLGADLFADRDALALGPVERVAGAAYPGGLADAAGALAGGRGVPWMFTGGLENRPDVLSRLAAVGPLWGGPAHAIARLRDPFWVAAAMRREGLPFAEVVKPGSPVADARDWLDKPLASAGGHGVRDLDPAAPPEPESRYWQRRVVGQSVSGVFLCGESGTGLIAVSRQLIGTDWLNAPRPYQYAGSVLPPDDSWPPWLRQQFKRVGAALLGESGLVGLAGIDAVLTVDSVVPVEVNPRYTASMELFERAERVSLVSLHCLACRGDTNSTAVSRPPRRDTFVKGILFAPRDVEIPPEWPPADFECADLPHAGDRVPAGLPLVTLLGQGRGVEVARDALRSAADRLIRTLSGTDA